MGRASAKRALARADRYLNLGAAGQRSGDLVGAEANYRRALGACADHAPSMHSLALLLHGRGKRAEAIALLERVVELEDSAAALNNLANLLSEAGRAGEAVKHYRRALVLDDANVSARFNFAKALQSTGDPQGAVAELRLLAAREPDDAGVHAALGAALLDAGDADEAARALDRALAIDPVHPDALNELGLVHLDRGAFELAADCFRQALDAEPGMAVACVNLVKTRRFGDGDSDAQDLERVQAMLDRPGLSPAVEIDLRFAMGKALDDRGDYAKAFEHYGRGNALARRGIQFDGGEPLRRAEATARGFHARIHRGARRMG